MSSSTVNTEHQFSVPRGFFELLLLLIAASEICAVCCLCLLNREHTHRGGIHLDNLYVFGEESSRADHHLRKGTAALNAAGLRCGEIGYAARERKVTRLWFDGASGRISVPDTRLRLIH